MNWTGIAVIGFLGVWALYTFYEAHNKDKTEEDEEIGI